MGEHRQQYSEEFKKQTVQFVQEQKQKKNVTDIAKEMQISLSALYEWMKQYREFEQEPVAREDRILQLEQELRDKERELKAKDRQMVDTEEQLAIVKKAVHIFSKPKP